MCLGLGALESWHQGWVSSARGLVGRHTCDRREERDTDHVLTWQSPSPLGRSSGAKTAPWRSLALGRNTQATVAPRSSITEDDHAPNSVKCSLNLRQSLHTETWAWMSTAVSVCSCIIHDSLNWKSSKCPSPDEQTNKMWAIHTVETSWQENRMSSFFFLKKCFLWNYSWFATCS